ncbi:MAG: PspA-associated protein PspAB [Actinomycetota bacterium]
MGFLDAILGRQKPKQANLDALFGLPSAAVTLETAAGLAPTDRAAVCFKPPSGQSFANLVDDIRATLNVGAAAEGLEIGEERDRFGYEWVVLRQPGIEQLVTSAHLVNTSLQEQGYGPHLLCSVFGFVAAEGGTRVYVVYLYKRGTFYPFVPEGEPKRNNAFELRVRGLLEGELPIEQDLTRWFPIWGLPI